MAGKPSKELDSRIKRLTPVVSRPARKSLIAYSSIRAIIILEIGLQSRPDPVLRAGGTGTEHKKHKRHKRLVFLVPFCASCVLSPFSLYARSWRASALTQPLSGNPW